MTELSRIVLESYQVRKTKKQKQAFAAFLQNYIPQLQVQESGLFKCRNLVIGDPAAARVILGAHYDTCPQLPFPNFITPKKPLLSVLYSVLMVLPYLIVILLSKQLLNLLHLDFWTEYWISLAAYIFLLLLILDGPANPNTANDNTSGVITLLEIYQALSPEQRENVCFVLFDNEEKGLLGSAQFRKKYKKEIKNALMINFDCVSDGDHFLLAVSKPAKEKYGEALESSFPCTDTKQVLQENLKKVYYPSDQAGFPMAVAVASLKYKKPFGYYMDRIHTKRDTVFEEANIDYLKEHTIQLIESI